MPPVIPNPLAAFIAQYQRRKAELDSANWTFPEPPEPPPDFRNFRLQPRAQSTLAPLPTLHTLAQVRAELPELIRDYFIAEPQDPLIVKGPAGVGKTQAALGVLQDLAESGLRFLWCSAAHKDFETLANFPNFDARRWYHWQPIAGQIDETEACQYSGAQTQWSRKGYQAFDLCQKLCGKHSADYHLKVCPYRLQEKRREPLVFAMHHHLTSGIAVSGFHGVVIDELPLGAFIRQRLIPHASLDLNASGPVKELIEKIKVLGAHGKQYSGKALLDELGPVLADVYAQVEMDIAALPQVPNIYRPEDVAQVQWWYLMEFLDLAQAEYEAWKRNWPRWAERVKVNGSGLHLLNRQPLWKKLPERAIILDATGQAPLYEKIFQATVTAYAPHVARVGKVYQVAGRMNGKNALASHEKITAAGEEALVMVRQLIDKFGYKKPGIVCHKALRPHCARIVGDDFVQHFGNMRGTNNLINCDGGFVIGTSGPGLQDVISIATALDDKRILPFVGLDDNGIERPLYRFVEREYRLTPEALADWQPAATVTRLVGEYTDASLRAVHDQLREAELVQGIHRFRVNVQKADVWLLSGVPLLEEIDGLFQDPPLAPPGIHWRVWGKLEPYLLARYAAGESVTYADLAAALTVNRRVRGKGAEREKAVSEKYMQNHKWLNVIAAYLPELWEVDRITPKNNSKGTWFFSLVKRDT